MTDNERIAVLENEMEHYKGDITELFKLMRDHIRKDEEYMDKADKSHQDTLESINSIKTEMKGNKSFIAGVVFTATGLWALVTTAVYWILQFKHS